MPTRLLVASVALWASAAMADVVLTADQANDNSWVDVSADYCEGTNCVTGEYQGYAGRYSTSGVSTYTIPDGAYTLSLWNICFYALADQTYQVNHDGGSTSVVVPQASCGQWVEVGAYTFAGGSVVLDADHPSNTAQFAVQVAVMLVDGSAPPPPPPPPPPPAPTGVVYDFTDCSDLADWLTHQSEDNPYTGCRNGYFIADLIRDTGSAPYTGSLFYSAYTGRMDGTLVSFPFTVTAYDVGISSLNAEPILMPDPSGQLYSGVVGRSTAFDGNWFHAVVGWQNGNYVFEWKQTTDSVSDPVGAVIISADRVDIRIIGNIDCSLTFQYRVAGGAWMDVPSIGQTLMSYPCTDMYVGPMTYGTTNPAVQFTGSMGSLEISQ